jgi:hypothetical protein
VVGLLRRQLVHRRLIVPICLVTVVFGGGLMCCAGAVFRQNGGLLVGRGGAAMRKAGLAVAFGRRMMRGLGPSQRFFGSQLRTAHALCRHRLPVRELFPPPLQLFGARTSSRTAITRSAC